MTQPSNLKVKRLLELDELPPGAAEEAWMYAVRPGNPNKDHKVFLPDLIEEAVEVVSDEILQEAGEYTDQEVDQVRQDLLSPADSLGTDMVTYKLDDTDSVARSLKDKLGDIVSVKDFGARGDGVTDDTAAIMAAFNFVKAGNRGRLLFPPGRYAVTSMVWTGGAPGSGIDIEFQRATLVGVADAPVAALLTLHNFRQAVIRGIELETDGYQATGAHENYGCALRLTSDNGNSPTQFVTIDGINIRYFKAGIVHGNLLGDAPQPSYPQSEIFIRNYKNRGVMQLFYGNALNGYLTFSGSVFSRFRSESHASWWDAANAFCIRNDAGQVVSIGDEFQVSEAGGYNNYGKDIVLIGPVFEHSVTDYITGDYSISDNVNGFYGSGSLSPFTIAPGSTGRLLLHNVKLRRPNGTAATSKSVLVDAKGSPDYRVMISGSRFYEWASDLGGDSGFLIRGGRGSMKDVVVDNTGSALGVMYIDDSHNLFTVADPTGDSIATDEDLAAKGGWTGSGSNGAFYKYTADLPAGHSAAIRITTSSGVAVQVTSPNTTGGYRVAGDAARTIRLLMKMLGATDIFRIQVQWFNWSGVQVGSTTTVYSATGTRMTNDGFDDWQELRIPVNVPAGTVFGRLVFWPGADADVAVTGIKVI